MSIFIMGDHFPHPHEWMTSPPCVPGETAEGDNRQHHGPQRSGPHHHHRGSRSHRGFPFGSRGRPVDDHHGFQRGPGPHHPSFDDPSGPRGGRGGMFGSRGDHHPPHGFHHGPHHRGGRGMPHPPHGLFPPGGPFGFQPFFERLASELGNGFEEFLPGHDDDRDMNDEGNQIDFVPRADVFNTTAEYIVHVSLPGAQKSDVSVEYDTEESTLRLAGVIHRPEFNEELHEAMVIDERRREVGVFERSIKLGSRLREIVNIDAENMSAKLVDGVLIVRLPKAESQTQGGRQKKRIIVNEDTEINETDSHEEKQDATNGEKNIENSSKNEKHASVIEVQDETDSMDIHSETETGDLLEEVDQVIYTPSQMSEEDAQEAAEYVKVDSK